MFLNFRYIRFKKIVNNLLYVKLFNLYEKKIPAYAEDLKTNNHENSKNS